MGWNFLTIPSQFLLFLPAPPAFFLLYPEYRVHRFVTPVTIVQRFPSKFCFAEAVAFAADPDFADPDCLCSADPYFDPVTRGCSIYCLHYSQAI